MAKLLCLGDIHATERPPSSCTDTYLEDILDLLAQTTVLCKNENISAAVWAGDVFHHKAPSRTSHRLVQSVIRIIRAYPCPLYIVPGNHDIQNDRLESINVTQPLGVLFQAGARLLDGWEGKHPEAKNELPLFGLPWQQRWEDGLLTESLDDWRMRVTGHGSKDNCLLVTHAPLYPPGLELPYENYPAASFAAAMGGRGSVYYGHVHEAHGTYTAGGVQFCNNGAISRGSLHEHNLTRQVSCTIWDSETDQFERVPLTARPADQVFRLQEKAAVTDMQGRLDEFLESIGSTSLEVMSVEKVLEHVRSRQLGHPIELLVEELLTEARRK